MKQVEVRYRCDECGEPVRVGNVTLAGILAYGAIDVARSEADNDPEGDFVALVCDACQEKFAKNA